MKKISLAKLWLPACLFFVCVLPGSLYADVPLPDRVESPLLQQLAAATTEAQGRQLESQLWEYWFNQSPTTRARELLDAGRQRRESYDYAGAEQQLDTLVATAPDYAEGYNQRAFVRFLREDFEGALADLEVTLQMKPWHFGALSGMYHVLRIQNRPGAAFDVLRSAVAIHPWIQERGALPEDRWPDNYRQLQESGQEI
jgi:tetratricopeptide (TPR) repeat protein